MKKRKILLLFVSLFLSNLVLANEPIAISTFQSIGIYWTPPGGSATKDVLVEYRIDGTSTWHSGLAMKHNPIADTENDLAEYRGSIVNLTPNTTYQIKLTLDSTATSEIFTATTWQEVEDFVISSTIAVGSGSSQYTISSSGSEEDNEYILYDGTNSTIDVDSTEKYCIEVPSGTHHVIIKGFTLIGAERHGIVLGDSCHDIIIENCDISNWGRKEEGFAKEFDSGIFFTNGKDNPSEVRKIIVQRCRIHHPRHDSNNWGEFNEQSQDYHPRGARGISLYYTKGNHVIRYNEFYSDTTHMFNDILGTGGNASYNGYPGFDTDIYGNFMTHCWDDGIESEGANRNVRIWGNFIDQVYITIGNAASSIGPLYIWKNISGRSYTPPAGIHGQYAAFMKMGFSKDISWMQGYTYVFNNTILQPNGNEGAGGLGTRDGADHERPIRHCITRNNILNARSGANSVSSDNRNENNDIDYDLCSAGYPNNTEANGKDGTPTYIDGASFDYVNRTANFSLNPSSLGYNEGAVIPNFTDGYIGTKPDMGAFEEGQVREYGVNAYLNASPKYTLTANAIGNGSILPGGGNYDPGTEITLTATPTAGWQFDNWTGDFVGTNNPQTLTMNSNKVVSAHFSIAGQVNKLAPEGSGTSEDPYQIASLANLSWLTQQEGSHDAFFVQTNSIDASVTATWDDNDDDGDGDLYNDANDYTTTGNNDGWLPIETFAGSYDGNNHIIEGLTIARSTNYVGFFGKIISGTVKDLGLTNINYITSGGYIGGLAALCNGNLIESCYSTGEIEITNSGSSLYNFGGLLGRIGNISTSTVNNSYSKVNISNIGTDISKNIMVGGLVGYADGDASTTISQCYSTGTVVGNRAGGLVGYCKGTITQSYSTGNVTGLAEIGGFVGYMKTSGTISNCYSSGDVACDGGDDSGGFVGEIEAGCSVNKCYSVGQLLLTGKTNQGFCGDGQSGTACADNYWDKQTSGQDDTDGGHSDDGAIGKLTTEMKTQTTFDNATANWDFVNIWEIIAAPQGMAKTNANGNYPRLQNNIDLTLPVELLSFNSIIVDGTILLSWKTATEVNNYGFEIEHSLLSITSKTKWEAIGFVEGRGNSSIAQSYSFTAPVAQVKQQFRLKQIDLDGNVNYSNIITVELHEEYEYRLAQNYPNPFNPSTEISFTIPLQSNVKISIYNVLGEKVAELLNSKMEAGKHSVYFNASELTSGIYIYRIDTPSFTKSMKMILIK